MPKSVTVYRVNKQGYLKKVGTRPCPADDLMPPIRRKSKKTKEKDAATSLPTTRKY